MEQTKVYSSIPMRTWRWLGVNDARQPEGLPSELEEQEIHVGKGEKEAVVVVYREARQGCGQLRAHVEAGGELKLVKIQLLPADVPHVDAVEVRVEEGARLYYTAVEAGSAHSATKLLVELAGDDSIADVAAIYFGDEQRAIDMNYVIRQQGRNTDANMQVRGALMDESQKIFRGTLDFVRGSKKSIGREKEEVVLLSPKVRNRSVPLMLSGEDDVDGHHAVSVGKMDQDKLFYLMSRGLDLAEAQRLVVEASFQPVLERIPEEALRQEIEKYIKGRISNGTDKN